MAGQSIASPNTDAGSGVSPQSPSERAPLMPRPRSRTSSPNITTREDEEGYTTAPATMAMGPTEESVNGPHPPDSSTPPTPQQFRDIVLRPVEIRLYTSHLLSTWNSRLFEFSAVLFLASIFPDTLLPMSVYALVRSGAAILFAQPVGSLIDRGNRLAVVRLSIVGQRVAVAASCALFLMLERQQKQPGHGPLEGVDLRDGLFALIVLFACVEKLAALLNLVSVERDWVVVIAQESELARQVLNARIRRIDLFCKLVGPLFISVVAIASTRIAMWTTLTMTLSSVLVEYICIAQVYNRVPSLRVREEERRRVTTEDDEAPSTSPSVLSQLKSSTYQMLPISSLPFYFNHSAFLPSFSLALLYLTVLSFSGQMVTYLISVGYNPLYVGIARTLSTVFELSATWVAPRMAKRIGVVRGGIWSLSWQMICLTGGISWFLSDINGMGTNSAVSATGLAVGVALSRVGLWGYDLCAQSIVQEEVEPNLRGSFSAAEASFQNLFEMLSYASTVIFPRPEQFQWPVIVSAFAAYTAGGLYAFFVRRRRGHLFHPPPCVGEKRKRNVVHDM